MRPWQPQIRVKSLGNMLWTLSKAVGGVGTVEAVSNNSSDARMHVYSTRCCAAGVIIYHLYCHLLCRGSERHQSLPNKRFRFQKEMFGRCLSEEIAVTDMGAINLFPDYLGGYPSFALAKGYSSEPSFPLLLWFPLNRKCYI